MRKANRGEPGITLELANKEISVQIDDAISFISDELESDWELAERYYNGETDLPEIEGRSNAVKTEVRDAVRNTIPSIMRVLMHSRCPVVYIPSSPQHSAWVEQQGQWVTQLFYQNDGYMQLVTAVTEALKLKRAPMKVYWESDPLPKFEKYTSVPFKVVNNLIRSPDFEVQDFETATSTQLGEESGVSVELFNVWGHRIHTNGRIRLEAVPNYEFFISRNCYSIEHAIAHGVHGHRAIVTVAEAMDMGLDYDEWLTLDAEDPEQSDHSGSSTERTQQNKTSPNDPSSVDLLAHKFLLTECYVSYDLKDTGRPQLYKFYYGGSKHVYLDHEEVEDSEFALIIPIPIPHCAHGHSLADLTIERQDTSSSLLRATVDNAHMTNDARIAADPNKTDFNDIMNPAANAPIKKSAGDTLQIIQIPSTIQSMLPLMEYLDRDIQNQVGVTKAAQGLDPDAMQSTDKNAVLNTIQTSQGQVEFMARNIIETGLTRVFRLLMRLSIRHQDPTQILMTKGVTVPIDTGMFDPDATAIPNVGLGTASPMQKQAALMQVIARQEAIMEKYGPNNPLTSHVQIYNAQEDLLEAQGVYNIHRYFNVVTPDVEAEWARVQAEQQQAMMQQAQANQPEDPSKAFREVEQLKDQTRRLEIATTHQREARDLELKAITAEDKSDIERDKLVQERVIKLAEIARDEANAKIKEEQKSNDEFVSRRGKDSGPKSA